jgi:pyrroloquinoline quinone (PQQ) biosynthesis protein C
MMAATETFEEALSAAARLDMRRNPFVAAIVAGRCSRDQIRAYAAGLFALSDRFPLRLAATAAICDDPDVRLALLENLMEEEGVVRIEEGRLIRDDSRRHATVARRFALAAGASDDALLSASEHEAATATWLTEAIAGRRLAAALAYLTVGIEGSVPATLSLVADALSRHYQFADEDLEFLTSHVAFDAAHGAAGARMTARVVRSDADRADALEGARRGAVAWWWFHRSMLAARF